MGTLRSLGRAVDGAERDATDGIQRLVTEKLTIAGVSDLTGLDQTTIRRLRWLQPIADDKAPATNAGTPGPA